MGILLAYIVSYALAPWEAWLMIGLAVVPAAAVHRNAVHARNPALAGQPQPDGRGRTRAAHRPRTGRTENPAEIREAHRRTQEEGRWRDLTAKSIRPALLIGLGLAVLQQFVRINTIIYYAPTTLTQLG